MSADLGLWLRRTGLRRIRPRLRGGWAAVPLLAAVLLLNVAVKAEQQASPILLQAWQPGQFLRSTLLTGEALGQTVLAGAFEDPNRKDLLVLQMQRDKSRDLRLYRQIDGLFADQPVVRRTLPDDVIFVDTGRLQGRDILVLFSPTEASSYDPLTGLRQLLLAFPNALYSAPADKTIPVFDAMRDLNADGLDDFIIAGFDGYRVAIQLPDGQFSPLQFMPAPAIMQMSYNNHPWYKSRKIYHTDINGDGQADLGFWLGQAFMVYLQRDGRFAASAVPLASSVSFEAEGFEGISMRMGGEDQSNVVKKALFQLRDLDGDQYADLVTLEVKSEGVFKKQTTYDFYRGGAKDQAVSGFSATPDSSIRSTGIQFDLVEEDLDNDGQLDIIISSIELGLTKIVRALLTGSVRIDLGFYQMRQGNYPPEPNLVRSIKATFSMSSGDVFFPSVLRADVSGDGRADLLVQEGDNTLLIYPGVAGDKLFASDAIEVAVAMPAKPELVQVVDLNNDGKQDLLLRHEVQGKPFRIEILIAD